MRQAFRLYSGRQVFEETRQLMETSVSNLEHGYSSASGDLSANWKKAAEPGEVLESYKGVMSNPTLRRFFDTLANDDLLTDIPGINARFFDINSLFYRATDVMHANDSMGMGDFILRSEILKSSARKKTTGGVNREETVFLGMKNMLRKCPQEDKVKLFLALDGEDAYLPLRLRLEDHQGSSIAYFLKEAFEGTPTETALTALRVSDSWKGVRKDKKLAEWIAHVDQRFFPALDF